MLYGASTYTETLHHTNSDSGHFSRVINIHAFVENATTCFLARLRGSSLPATHAFSSAGLAQGAGWRVDSLRHGMRHSCDGCLLQSIIPSIFLDHLDIDQTSQDKSFSPTKIRMDLPKFNDREKALENEYIRKKECVLQL